MVVITNDILKALSVSLSLTIRLAIFLIFSQGKCKLLYFYIYISLIDPIFTFSLQPGSGGKPFADILCDCCCSWALHNIGHSTSNIEQSPSSVARLKLDGASGCGVTRYRVELRIFMKL